MNLNWTTIKIYFTPPATPPFPIGGVKSVDELIDLSPVVSPEVSVDTTDKSFDELTDGSTNGSVKSFDQLIDNLWFLLKMMLDGVEKKNGDYWQQSHHRTVLARSTHPSNSS
jgi:fructose-bisphosphate aldolase class 1